MTTDSWQFVNGLLFKYKVFERIAGFQQYPINREMIPRQQSLRVSFFHNGFKQQLTNLGGHQAIRVITEVRVVQHTIIHARTHGIAGCSRSARSIGARNER